MLWKKFEDFTCHQKYALKKVWRFHMSAEICSEKGWIFHMLIIRGSVRTLSSIPYDYKEQNPGLFQVWFGLLKDEIRVFYRISWWCILLLKCIPQPQLGGWLFDQLIEKIQLVEMIQSSDALIFVRCWITRSIRQSQCNTLLNCKGKTFWKYRLIRTGIKHVTAGWQCDGIGGDCRTLQPGRFRWTPFLSPRE